MGEKLYHCISETFGVIVMDHMSGLFNLHQGASRYRFQPLVHIGADGLVALLSLNQKDRTLDAAKKLYGLS